MIRQAISCDICAAEKKQTNHWFVAYEQNEELRISGWSSRNRLRAGSKHLCGQICLHKLVDDFMARTIAVRAHKEDGEVVEAPAELQAEGAKSQPSSRPSVHYSPVSPSLTDMSLTSDAAFLEEESSARLITPLDPPAKSRAPAELVQMPERAREKDDPRIGEDTRYSSRDWHAEAWERERERELRSAARQRSNR